MTPSRKNLLDLKQDSWTPPLYTHNGGWFEFLHNLAFFLWDLQFVSILRDLKQELPNIKGNVLDAGCGVQPYRYLFTDKAHYVGIDTVESEDHFGYRTPDTLYFSGDVWPVKSGTIDFILSTETLEHVARPAKFAAEAARVLKPGAKMVLTIPFMARWHFIPYDYQRLTPSGLELLLTDNGFERVRVYARGNLLTVMCYKIMAYFFFLLSATGHWWVRLSRIFFAFLISPFILLATFLAHISLAWDGTTDCLGFTVEAYRSAGLPRKNKNRSRK